MTLSGFPGGRKAVGGIVACTKYKAFLERLEEKSALAVDLGEHRCEAVPSLFERCDANLADFQFAARVIRGLAQ